MPEADHALVTRHRMARFGGFRARRDIGTRHDLMMIEAERGTDALINMALA
jgi:hypothetical protein